ncbi:MAG: 4Fe-4S binding protein [Anaerolineales bacterium]|nr:4Fe-4S binding protein [Anaerolineales bacterium]
MHLEIHAEKCTGCRICENFCSFHHEGAIWPARARITIVAQVEEAHRMLEDIYGWFSEGFDTPDLKDAQTLLEELGAI